MIVVLLPMFPTTDKYMLRNDNFSQINYKDRSFILFIENTKIKDK